MLIRTATCVTAMKVCEEIFYHTSLSLNHGTEDYMQEEMQSVKYWCTLQV
jgi:hypothetical protein